MVIACTAPLTAMASNFTLSLGFGAGVGTLGWIVVVGVLLAAFSLGYLLLSRHVVNAGAYFAFIGFGLGRTAGSASAIIATIAYNMAAAAMVAATGYFADIAMATYLNVDIAWYLYSIGALILIGGLGYYGVGIAARITTVVCVGQFLLLGALSLSVLLQSPEGFSATGFTPDAMLSGNYTLALVFCFLSFAGYEASAIFAEECEAPEKTVRRATYGALALLAVVYLVANLSIIAAFADPVVAAREDPGTVVTRAADQYLGTWSGVLISASLAISFLAAAIAFHNMAARYQFALGRAKLLPRGLGRTHLKHGTPFVSSLTQTTIVALILAPFVLAGMDPLTNLFPAVSGVTSIATIYLMAACSISVVVGSLRGLVHGPAISARVAPSVVAVCLLTIEVIIVINYRDVTGSESVYVALMPMLLVIGACYGAVKHRRTEGVVLGNELREPRS